MKAGSADGTSSGANPAAPIASLEEIVVDGMEYLRAHHETFDR